MPDLPAILTRSAAARRRPRWLALAGWLSDNGQYDQAAAVRVFWPVLRKNVAESKVSLDETVRQLGRHAKLLGRRAQEVEERAHGRSDD